MFEAILAALFVLAEATPHPVVVLLPSWLVVLVPSAAALPATAPLLSPAAPSGVFMSLPRPTGGLGRGGCLGSRSCGVLSGGTQLGEVSILALPKPLFFSQVRAVV